MLSCGRSDETAQVSCDPALPLPVYKGQESLMEDGPDAVVSGRESIIKHSDVRREICVVSDQCPGVVPKLAAVPLAVPVVVQTRPQVGWESTMKMSDVSHDICIEPDQCPVVVPKEAGEWLALPVVALTRSQAGCAPVFTWPVNDDMISQVGVDPVLLAGRVIVR